MHLDIRLVQKDLQVLLDSLMHPPQQVKILEQHPVVLILMQHKTLLTRQLKQPQMLEKKVPRVQQALQLLIVPHQQLTWQQIKQVVV
jgi:hypothetical protein